MIPLHSGMTPTPSSPKVVFNFPVERDLGMTPGRARRDLDAQTILLTLLASQLQATAPVPVARQQEATVLFCDIADYARLAERVDPALSYRLVSEVLERVTACVQAHAGRVIDYYGDGVLVLWNPTGGGTNLAALACQTALAIQAELPGLSRAWNEVASAPLRLRCTLNVGSALVGNTGTRRCPKYGAAGHTVNLTQRMQMAGKFFCLPILATAAVCNRVAPTGGQFRRLGWARLTGLAEPTDLYELHAGDGLWQRRRDAYEAALAHFEARRWLDACQAFRPLLDGPAGQLDVPCLHLMGRAIEYLKSPPSAFDAAWELTGR